MTDPVGMDSPSLTTLYGPLTLLSRRIHSAIDGLWFVHCVTKLLLKYSNTQNGSTSLLQTSTHIRYWPCVRHRFTTPRPVVVSRANTPPCDGGCTDRATAVTRRPGGCASHQCVMQTIPAPRQIRTSSSGPRHMIVVETSATAVEPQLTDTETRP